MAQTEGRREKPPAWLRMTDSSWAAIVYMLHILKSIGVLEVENSRSCSCLVAQLCVSLFFPASVLVLVLALVLVLPVPAVPAAVVDRVFGGAAGVVVGIADGVAIECLGFLFHVVAKAVAFVVIDLASVAIVVVVVAVALI